MDQPGWLAAREFRAKWAEKLNWNPGRTISGNRRQVRPVWYLVSHDWWLIVETLSNLSDLPTNNRPIEDSSYTWLMDFFPFGIEILFLQPETDLKSAFLLELLEKNRTFSMDAALAGFTSFQKVEEEWRWRDRWSLMLITTKNSNKNLNFQTREFLWNFTISS